MNKLKLHNTLGNKVEEFIPINIKNITLKEGCGKIENTFKSVDYSYFTKFSQKKYSFSKNETKLKS